MGLRERRIATIESRFTTGAVWIGSSRDDAIADLTRTFLIPFPPTEAILRVAMDPAGAAKLNGDTLCRGGLGDGFRRIQEIDVASSLRAGQNEATLTIRRGGGALCWLQAKDAEGHTVTLGSDDEWKDRDRPASVLRRGWLRPWRSAREPMRIVPLSRLRLEPPRWAAPVGDGLYDLGSEDVGYPIAENLAQGAVLSFGESRDEALAQAPMQRDDGSALDTSGMGFRRRAFRFARVAPDAQGSAVGIVPVRGGPVPRGSFSCADPAIDHAYEISKRTVELCAQGVLEDGVKRDRAAWIGDLLVSLPATLYVFGPHPALPESLRRLGSQHDDRGAIFPVYPPFGKWLLDDYRAAWLLALDRYVELSGDAEILRELEGSVDRQHEALRARFETGALEVARDGPITDWMSHKARTGFVVYQQGMALWGLRSKILRGRTTLAAATLDRLRGEIRLARSAEGLYADRLGVSPTVRTQDASVLAVLSGIADDDASRVLDAVKAQLWTPHGTRAYLEPSDATGALNSGNVIAPFMVGLETLARFEHGNARDACELVRRTWSGMTESGCAYEFLDLEGRPLPLPGQPPFTLSLCHAWSAAPAWLLPAYVLGVRPASPGFGSYVVAPLACDLGDLRGTVPMGNDELRLTIQDRDEAILIEIAAPTGHDGWLVPGGLFPGSIVSAECGGRVLPVEDRYAIPQGSSRWVIRGAP